MSLLGCRGARTRIEFAKDDGIEDRVRAIFFNPVQYGDLARLVGRISVVLANEKADAPPTVIDVGRRRADGGAAMETREQLHRLVDTVASCVETPAQYEAIMDQTESILFGSGTPPHPSNPGLVERLFQEGIGLGSATSRVLKLVHQSVVLLGIGCLVERFGSTALGAVRDIREERGWQILVRVGAGNAPVEVEHVRRETCGDPALGEHGQFEVEWGIVTRFDSMLSDVESVKVMLRSVEFNPAVPEREREKIEHDLCGGSIVLGCATGRRQQAAEPRIGVPVDFRHVSHIGADSLRVLTEQAAVEI